MQGLEGLIPEAKPDLRRRKREGRRVFGEEFLPKGLL